MLDSFKNASMHTGAMSRKNSPVSNTRSKLEYISDEFDLDLENQMVDAIVNGSDDEETTTLGAEAESESETAESNSVAETEN
ncbi:hypothetical protein N0V86_005433 [Didymella sp. IMI 355093]|nr:hypothetical protein N0V86_005433 [Didymella sp. IMI 355093]